MNCFPLLAVSLLASGIMKAITQEGGFWPYPSRFFEFLCLLLLVSSARDLLSTSEREQRATAINCIIWTIPWITLTQISKDVFSWQIICNLSVYGSCKKDFQQSCITPYLIGQQPAQQVRNKHACY